MHLRDVVNIGDLRQLAMRRLPKMVFDYIDGGADDEVTLARNCAAFRAIELVWDVLVDVSSIDLRADLLGAEVAAPFFLTPTAASRLFHPEGERACARAAAAAGLGYSISTLASVPVEEVGAAHQGPKWFQVYVWKDRALVKDLLARARASGFTGVALTVDLPVVGNRERDPRNKFSVPPKPSWTIAQQMAARPGYLWDMLRSPRITAANLVGTGKGFGNLHEFVASQFDRAVTWDDAAWMRETWGGPFAIKGIARAGDAARAIDIGASHVWISNHGGRQLDTAPATIDLLPEIAALVGERAQIVLDGGVRRGSDIVKALCLGASAVAIGRAYLYGLGAAGEAGVAKAIAILKAEMERTMALLGARRLADLGPHYLRQRHSL